MSKPTITCPGCGDTHEAPHGDPDFLLRDVSKCSVCDARIVYGELAPRVVVEPGAFPGGQPAMVFRVQDPLTKADVHVMKLDPQHAFLIAQAIISMVRP